MEGLPSSEVARRFGYSAGAFRVLCHDFRRRALPEFFTATRPGRREQPKKSRAYGQVVALRKRNYSVYEISQTLKEQGTPLSATAVREMLAAEGFAPLPRRLDEERPVRVGPNAQAVANVGDFVLSPREFTTRTGGLFLFVPDLVRLDSDALAQAAKLPGSRMVPSAHALRASLALKLWAIERKSHIMALVADEGLALFCGLNAMPKKSFLSEYSSRITPHKVAHLLALWHARVTADLFTGASLNLDFHSVPYFGEHPLVESHYLAKRSRRQPSILVFLAQDADAQVFCYANADIRKGEEADEIFRFIDFWKRQHGKAPQHLVFDSKLTTYAGLDRLDAAGITFLTLRRRSPKLLADAANLPASAWRTVELDIPHVSTNKRRVRWARLPPVLHHRSRPRRAHHPAHQRHTLDRQTAHHPLRQAHAHRECARRRGALLPHRRAVLIGRLQGRLRHGASRARVRSLPPHGTPHARLRRRPGAPDLPRSHRHAGRRRHYRERNQGAVPSPRPSSHRPRIGAVR
jgi:transposase